MPDISALTNSLPAIKTGVEGTVNSIGSFAIGIGVAIALVFLVRGMIKRALGR
jgi:hypothetical protein